MKCRNVQKNFARTGDVDGSPLQQNPPCEFYFFLGGGGGGGVEPHFP